MERHIRRHGEAWEFQLDIIDGRGRHMQCQVDLHHKQVADASVSICAMMDGEIVIVQSLGENTCQERLRGTHAMYCYNVYYKDYMTTLHLKMEKGFLNKFFLL